MKKNSKLLASFLPLFAASALFLTSCDKDDDVDPVQQRSNVAFVNASPGSSPFDVYFGDEKATNGGTVAFGSSTGAAGSPYLQINSGDNQNIRFTDGTSDYYTGTLSLAADKNYSVFTYDTLNNGSFRTLVLEDNLTAPAADQSHVRFLHLSPDAPEVDIVLANETDTIRLDNKSYIGDNPVASELQNFTPVKSGTYTANVWVGDQSVLEVPGVVLESGKIYTAYAKGLAAGADANALGLGTVRHN